MCNAFVLLFVPTIICVCHSGTDVFSGNHCGVFLLVGYIMVRRRILNESVWFKFNYIFLYFGGKDFLMLIISLPLCFDVVWVGYCCSGWTSWFEVASVVGGDVFVMF